MIDDALFGGVIGVGDQIDGVLELDAKPGPRVLQQQGARSSGRFRCDGQQRFRQAILVDRLGHEPAS